MSNNSEIITLSTIATLYERNNMDRYDLLIPFIKWCINDCYCVNEIIDVEIIKSKMDKKFAFKDLPNYIINKLLDRISKEKGIVKKENKSYIYKKDVSNECDIMDNSIKKSHDAYNRICLDIKELLKDRITDKDKIDDIIINYLNEYGFNHVIVGRVSDDGMNRKERNNKKIAKHIYSLQENGDPLLADYELIVKGLIIKNVIYVKDSSYNEKKTKFDDLDVYLDTVLILAILGLKDDENYVNIESIKRLLPKNSRLKCFKHNYDEVQSIIANYKIGTIDSYRTLTKFELSGSEMEKEVFLTNLEFEMKKVGIEIDYRSFDELKQNSDKLVIDYSGLSNYLKEKIGGGYKRNGTILKNDVDTIQYLAFIRGNIETKYIEKSKAIFVSSNHNLINAINDFLSKKNLRLRNFAISETDLISILWIKNSDYNDKFTKNYLIDVSNSIVSKISTSFYDDVKNKVEVYIKDEQIDEKVLNMLENTHINRELNMKVNGDASILSPEIIKEVIENLDMENNSIAIKEMKRQYRIEKEKSDKRIFELEESNRKTDNQIEIYIQKEREKIYKICMVVLKVFASLLIIAIMFVVLFSYLNQVDFSNRKKMITSLIVAIVGCIGLTSVFVKRRITIHNLIKNISNRIANWKEKKLVDKFERK